jgi:hypothetical protein
MAISIATAATRLAAAAANVATQMGGGTTAAEVTALASLLTVLAGRPADSIPLLKLANTSVITPT